MSQFLERLAYFSRRREAFADGHGETHAWHVASTKAPPQPDAAPLPMKLPYRDWGDYNWVVQHMSVDRD